jgi:hypothetical protein
LPEEALQEEIRQSTARTGAVAARPATPNPANDIPGVTRNFRYNELIGKQGGFAACTSRLARASTGLGARRSAGAWTSITPATATTPPRC